MANSEIIEKALAYVEQLFKEYNSPNNHFHNNEHTLDVLKAVQDIGSNSNLTDEEMEIVSLAAVFHDIGHINQKFHHELESIKIACEFLGKENYPKENIEKITGCIMATMLGNDAKNLLEEVMSDADLYHLGTDEFEARSNALRKEWRDYDHKQFTDEEWDKVNIDFLGWHKYKTDYAQQKLDPVKQENLKKLKKKAKKHEKQEDKQKDKKLLKQQEEITKLEKKLAELKKPERGIETMFRTTSKNHLQLSAMADNKANIMISINSIIISVVITVLVRKLDTNAFLVIPTFILLLACLATIIVSVLATRPKVSSGRFSKDDIENKKVNLVFFGNFHKMDVDEYEWGMKEMMKDYDFLYSSLIKDIYFLGQVLGVKYRMLRLAYNVFMWGIIISVIAFIIAVQLNTQAVDLSASDIIP